MKNISHGILSIRLSEAHQEGDWELIEEIIQEWECENCIPNNGEYEYEY